MSTTPTPDLTSRSLPPFGLRDKIGYALGDLGNGFTFILAASFLMVFYTQVLGVNPVVAGLIMMLVRLTDAFVDIAVGRIADRSKLTPAGRFRPWIIRVAVPVAVASSLMYLFPAVGLPEAAKITYVSITYLLWSVLYSGVNIPYGSMAAVISPNPMHRTSLSVFRTFGTFTANIALNFTVPLLVYTRTADGGSRVIPEMFTWVAIVCSVLAILAYVGCYALSVERVRVETKAAHEVASMGRTLATLGKNRAMVSMVAGTLVLLMAMMLAGAMAQYLWLIYFNNGRMAGVATTMGLLPTLLLLPVASPLARRFGKREISVIGISLASAVYIGTGFLPLQNQPWVFIILMMMGGSGMGIFNMLIWAFVTDIIDYQEVLSHQRDDGVVYSVYSWARKVGQALASGLQGAALGVIGFTAGATQQSPGTVTGIYALSTTVPGVLLAAVAAILLLWYPLSKKAIAENTQTLNGRREAAATAAS